MKQVRSRATFRKIPSFRLVDCGLTALAVLAAWLYAVETMGGSAGRLAHNLATALASVGGL